MTVTGSLGSVLRAADTGPKVGQTVDHGVLTPPGVSKVFFQ